MASTPVSSVRFPPTPPPTVGQAPSVKTFKPTLDATQPESMSNFMTKFAYNAGYAHGAETTQTIERNKRVYEAIYYHTREQEKNDAVRGLNEICTAYAALCSGYEEMRSQDAQDRREVQQTNAEFRDMCDRYADLCQGYIEKSQRYLTSLQEAITKNKELDAKRVELLSIILRTPMAGDVVQFTHRAEISGLSAAQKRELLIATAVRVVIACPFIFGAALFMLGSVAHISAVAFAAIYACSNLALAMKV